MAEIYRIRSSVRDVQTRNIRQSARGARPGLIQRLAGGAIIVRRGRTATITAAQLTAFFTEIKRAWKEGRIEVTTVTGQVIDLDTMAVAPLDVSKPLPIEPDRTAAADKPQGLPIPMYFEGKGITEEVAVPSVMHGRFPDTETPSTVDTEIPEPHPTSEDPIFEDTSEDKPKKKSKKR